jgi:cbb3-type cytochrome oxidase subunit 3
VISRLPVVLLHQGGWDEILMFALPALATIWLLRRAERRARADAARREQDQEKEEPSNSTNGERP